MLQAVITCDQHSKHISWGKLSPIETWNKIFLILFQIIRNLEIIYIDSTAKSYHFGGWSVSNQHI